MPGRRSKESSLIDPKSVEQINDVLVKKFPICVHPLREEDLVEQIINQERQGGEVTVFPKPVENCTLEIREVNTMKFKTGSF